MEECKIVTEADELAWIIDGLKHKFQEPLPSDAVAEARRHRDEIVPYLIQCLAASVAAAENGDEDDSPSLISLCLLIEFRAAEAWPVIKKMLVLPGDKPFDVVGDGIHEFVSTAVALFAMDQLDELAELCLDRSVNEYCRFSIAKGVIEAFARDSISRETMIDFVRNVLENADSQDYEFRGLLIGELLDVPCDELRELIDSAFDNGLVDEFIVSKQCVAKAFDSGASRFQRYVKELQAIENLADTLRHWASFQPPSSRVHVSHQHTNPIPRPNSAPRFASSNLDISIPEPIVEAEPRVGRNSPCPCGSGKKYKKCCLRHEKSVT